MLNNKVTLLACYITLFLAIFVKTSAAEQKGDYGITHNIIENCFSPLDNHSYFNPVSTISPNQYYPPATTNNLAQPALGGMQSWSSNYAAGSYAYSQNLNNILVTGKNADYIDTSEVFPEKISSPEISPQVTVPQEEISPKNTIVITNQYPEEK